jgi:hypothetical protein
MNSAVVDLQPVHNNQLSFHQPLDSPGLFCSFPPNKFTVAFGMGDGGLCCDAEGVTVNFFTEVVLSVVMSVMENLLGCPVPHQLAKISPEFIFLESIRHHTMHGGGV